MSHSRYGHPSRGGGRRINSRSGSGFDHDYSEISSLPRLVSNILVSDNYQAWLVGSGVEWYLGRRKFPKDLDIIIAPDRWTEFTRMLMTMGITSPEMNAFGGLKLVVETEERIPVPLDVWPATVDSFFRQPGSKTPRWAMSLHPYIVLHRENG